MQTHALRLTPNTDLKLALIDWARSQQIEAACILTCVGSLSQASLRLAEDDFATLFHGKFEIVSLVGTLSRHGVHLHISIADKQGRTLGGHLMDTNIIFTTAEIVIGELPNMRFTREHDTNTGYHELIIQPHHPHA